jgi:hypothetical protein
VRAGEAELLDVRRGEAWPVDDRRLCDVLVVEGADAAAGGEAGRVADGVVVLSLRRCSPS